MIKADFVKRIAKETGIVKANVASVIQKTIDSIKKSLHNKERVEFRKFGAFELKACKSRKGRDPHKPEKEIVIPERVVVRFRASKELKKDLATIKPQALKT